MITRHSRARTLALLLAVAAAASCGHPPTIDTPEGKRAYTALEIAQPIGALQDAVIQANREGGLDDTTAIAVVRYTVTALKVLRETPEGWQKMAQTGFAQLVTELPEEFRQRYRRYLQTIAVVLQLDFGGAL